VRVPALQRVLSERGAGAALIASAESIRYFTGFYTWNNRVAFALAVVPARGEPVLLVPRADESLARAVGTCPLEPYDPGAAGFRTTAELGARVLGRLGVASGTIALESGAVSFDRARMLEEALPNHLIADGTAPIADLRIEKDPAEQDALRRAGGLAGEAMRQVASGLRPGITEIGLKASMEQAVYAEGARRWPEAIVQAETNVVSGPKLDRLHDAATGRPVGAGDLVFVIGKASVNGYHGDVGRTLFVPGGAPQEDARRDLGVAEAAHRAAVRRLRPGASLREAVDAADEVLAGAGMADRRTYPMVRGLGLRIDERPRVTTDLDLRLASGMCMCVQVYLKRPGGIVGRSDSVLVTDDGPAVLSQAGNGERG
jgi:Xaa-Pro dipeptidase